jgi:hypothetical protein
MQEIRVDTIDALRDAIRDLKERCLFRGQASHYSNFNLPSVVTSFDRKGCIPSEMLKWSRYASNVLDVFVGSSADSLVLTQALLQHYGWRSFFVDCSSSPAVAAWFGSHIYSDRKVIELAEDFGERPVMLAKRMAEYTFEEGEGHLYALDRDLCAKLIGATDLAQIDVPDARTRTLAQKAWLLGPLRNAAIPPEGYVAHIRASRALFREYARDGGFSETSDLFPGGQEDPILRALLSLPWKSIDAAGGPGGTMPIFGRALDIPEYATSYSKIAPSRTAFYRNASIGTLGSIDGVDVAGIVVKIPDIMLFGTAETAPLMFPKIMELIDRHGAVALEVDQLLQHANMGATVLYQKGIVVLPRAPDVVELGELMVEHPGLDLTSAGMVRGWFYQVQPDGSWARLPDERECSCGKDGPHLRHISAMHIAEAYLSDPKSFD